MVLMVKLVQSGGTRRTSSRFLSEPNRGTCLLPRNSQFTNISNKRVHEALIPLLLPH